MQLKLQRSQRMGGLAGSTVLFCLDVRAEYSAEERSNIGRYKIGSQVIYNSQASKRHLEKMGAELDRTQTSGLKEQAAGLAKGLTHLAMSKMHLNVSIASLGRGHHIECKDLEELIEAEDTVRDACKGLTRFLQVAETFDGSEVVIEYVNGEEQVHITQNAPPLLEYAGSAAGTAAAASPVIDVPVLLTADLERKLAEFWANPQYRKLVFYAGGALLVILMLRSCFG